MDLGGQQIDAGQEAYGPQFMRIAIIEGFHQTEADEALDTALDGLMVYAQRLANQAQRRVLRVAHPPDGTDILVLTAFFDRGARKP